MIFFYTTFLLLVSSSVTDVVRPTKIQRCLTIAPKKLSPSLEVSSELIYAHYNMKDTQTHDVIPSVCLSILIFQPVLYSSYSNVFWILLLAVASKSSVKIVGELSKRHLGLFILLSTPVIYHPSPTLFS